VKNQSQLRQKHLFLDSNIIKAVLIVSLPALAIAMMSGLYAFVDQILMVKLIPELSSSQHMFDVGGNA
jgi:hypothetical protein